MGVLPGQFAEGMDARELALDGTETYDLIGVGDTVEPGQRATLRIRNRDGIRDIRILIRIDTPMEAEYYKHGGILPYVLRDLLGRAAL